MHFVWSSDDEGMLSLAREAVTHELPLDRGRAGPGPVGLAKLGASGWLHASLSAETPLPVVAGILYESGRVAAVPEMVANAWLLPQLIQAGGEQADEWLAHQAAHPGAVTLGVDLEKQGDASHQIPGGAEGLDLYSALPADGDQPARLQRLAHGGVEWTPVAGLSGGLARAKLLPGRPGIETLELAVDPEQWARTELIATLLTAAGAVGIGAELVKRSVDYTCEREQFGRPIAQFQAVKHLLADAHTGVEVAWLAVQFAAADPGDLDSNLGVHPDPDAVDQAVLLALRAVGEAARVASQVHGAMGFTWESSLHYLLKAALDLRAMFAPSPVVARRVASTLLAGLTSEPTPAEAR